MIGVPPNREAVEITASVDRLFGLRRGIAY